MCLYLLASAFPFVSRHANPHILESITPVLGSDLGIAQEIISRAPNLLVRARTCQSIMRTLVD